MGTPYQDSIKRNIVLKVISQLPKNFYTKDVSENILMIEGHPGLVKHTHYHAFIGKYLKNNLKDSHGNPLLIEIRAKCSRGSLWEKRGTSEIKNTNQENIGKKIQSKSFDKEKVVRSGHFNTLRYMQTENFKEIKKIFESFDEIGGAYFRPVEDKVTVLDLHKDSPKPRIGVGDNPYISYGMSPEDIRISMNARIEYLKAKRLEIKGKGEYSENKLEANIIREAQKNNLIMPGFPEYFKFIHSQWRVDNPTYSSHSFTDIAAIDIRNNKLVIIELKAKNDNSAFHQVKEYVEYFQRNSEQLIPFFIELSKVMGKLYDCKDLSTLTNISVSSVGIVAWPNNKGSLQIQNLHEYEKSLKNSLSFTSFKDLVEKVDSDTEINESKSNMESVINKSENFEKGPQCSSDSSFKAKMRYHQSRYRANVLKVTYGIGPNESNFTKYGNMLTKEDGNNGLNFLSPKIFKAVENRVSENSGALDPFRLRNNMLTSQALCFNLFGMMDSDMKLASEFWNAHFPGKIKEVTSMKFEYSPVPNSFYLNDKTAFDVYFEYKNVEGKAGFIGIEVKFTESFSPKVYDTSIYRKWSNDPSSPWKSEFNNELSNISWNQLWRDHLLAVSILNQDRNKFSEGFLVLVRHPGDRECESVVNKYKTFLKVNDETFYDMPLDFLMSVYKKLRVSDEIRKWEQRFRERYDC